jgi:hypothetical protein
LQNSEEWVVTVIPCHFLNGFLLVGQYAKDQNLPSSRAQLSVLWSSTLPTEQLLAVRK